MLTTPPADAEPSPDVGEVGRLLALLTTNRSIREVALRAETLSPEGVGMILSMLEQVTAYEDAQRARAGTPVEEPTSAEDPEPRQ